MKNIFFLISLFFFGSVSVSAQVYRGNLYEFFDNQQPDARSEALGKIQATLYGSPSTSFYNPASSSFSEGLNVQFSNLHPQYYEELDGLKYNTYGISYNSKKYGAIAFSLRYLNYGDFKCTTADDPDVVFTESDKWYNYTLNYSYMPISDLSVGLNINYFRRDFFNPIEKGWYFDLGILKRIAFDNEASTQNIFIGASCSNIGNSEVKYDDNEIYFNPDGSTSLQKVSMKEPLPSNLRIGASYDYETKLRLSGFKIFKAMLSTEYSDLVNSKSYTTIKAGAEFTFLEIIQLRLGYYNEKIYNNWFYENKKNLSEFTYGAGINIPIQKIFDTNIPVALQFDYANLRTPKTNVNFNIDKNYSVFNLNLNVGI
jgi:hypothetical protein